MTFHVRRNKSLALFSVGFIVLLIVYREVKKEYVISNLESRLAALEPRRPGRYVLEMMDKQAANFIDFDDNTILLYNRVPKTGSTSFAGIAYELCYKNKYHVLHVNITKNSHLLSVRDQLSFIHNISEWTERRPALYHGHFYFMDLKKLGLSDGVPVYINIIRNPLDRLLSYYYFMRYGDNFRPQVKRRRMGSDMTFDECVEQGQKDCDPVNLWLQIPFFCGHSYRCRQPGSRWALDMAKYNLINHYLLVGITEELGDFIAMLEVILPRFFHGAMELYLSGERSHLRQTNKKESPSEGSIKKIQESTIWKMEQEFYEFASIQFHFQKRLLFQAVDSLEPGENISDRKSYLLSDGKLYVPKEVQIHYEKVRPR